MKRNETLVVAKNGRGTFRKIGAVGAVIGAALVGTANAQTDPTAALSTLITTDWALLLAAGVIVMTGTIAMAVIKRFRRVM